MVRPKGLTEGIGINDVDFPVSKRVNGKQVLEPSYLAWRNMLKRVKRKDAYKHVSVCDEWLRYSNFHEWFVNHYVEGYELDKDILSGSVYSPDTCLFIPMEINKLILTRKNHRGEYPLGVSYEKSKGKYQAKINRGKGKSEHIGYYYTAQEAHDAWYYQKLIYATKVVSKYTLPDEVKHHIFKYITTLHTSQ